MSERPGRIVWERDEQLNQLILAFKRQHLAPKPRNLVEERNKRLFNYFNNVDGRKLDQDKPKFRSKLFGQYADILANKRASVKMPTNKNKVIIEESTKMLNEILKNFAFSFPNDAKSTCIKEKTKNKLENITKPSKEHSTKSQKGKSVEKSCKYELDRMYFVLDTNILIHSLYLLEDVANLTPSDTVGCILFVPYVVIKELDKLKVGTRSYAARRAVEYLNRKFDDNDKISAQSATEHTKELIDVDNPDDSVINCCLQLKKQVPHMMLLTNDKNLRLKARASFIRVSNCEELTKSKYCGWSLQRGRRHQRI